MAEGVILKGIGGFYYVKTEDGIYECRARGRFKEQGMTPLVGDRVEIEILDTEPYKGVVDEIFPRKNTLLRPAVANVDQAVLVFAVKNPDLNRMLLDKMLVLAEFAELDCLICFNKSDLDQSDEIEDLQKIYGAAGYPVIRTCVKSGEGVAELTDLLAGKISVFSGPSGVGKSSLLNAIESKFSLETGAVSEKIKRGKHTTRHSELMQLTNGGKVVDTPGFTSLTLEDIDPEVLWTLFPEFEKYSEACRFINCMHLNEPDCGVKGAVESGEIDEKRYEAYDHIYREIMTIRKRGKR
jgi:ribosome biogenesis GTPase